METHHKHAKINTNLVRIQKEIEENIKITQDLKMKRKEVRIKKFMSWTARPHPQLLVEIQGVLLQGHQWGHLDRGRPLREAVGAYRQTPKSTRPSNLPERLYCKYPGAAWSLLYEPPLTPG